MLEVHEVPPQCRRHRATPRATDSIELEWYVVSAQTRKECFDILHVLMRLFFLPLDAQPVEVDDELVFKYVKELSPFLSNIISVCNDSKDQSRTQHIAPAGGSSTANKNH